MIYWWYELWRGTKLKDMHILLQLIFFLLCCWVKLIDAITVLVDIFWTIPVTLSCNNP